MLLHLDGDALPGQSIREGSRTKCDVKSRRISSSDGSLTLDGAELICTIIFIIFLT